MAFYITTAITYPNANPHIGHAYEYVCTDMIARFHRLDGQDVFFATGTDEHGLKIQRAAEEAKITPMQLVDKNSDAIKDLQHKLNISFDRFIRTTEKPHYDVAQDIWEKMLKNGDIYKDTYEGWYSVKEETYIPEENTRLESDGTRVDNETGSKVEWTQETSYFFKLSAYQDKLLELYKEQPEFITPQTRKNEIVSFVKSGLKDLSISRSTFNWGVPVPGDSEHIMYVWVDALTNYLTAAGYLSDHKHFETFWPPNVQIIGKDIIRFHTVYWPAFLMSAGISLPKRVATHGFLLNDGEKMSKSLGNVVDPLSLIQTLGVDPLRYYFIADIPYGQDSNYSAQTIATRLNADLANDYGNLAQRALTMIAKNFDGKLPALEKPTKEDKEILESTNDLLEKVRENMESQQIHLATAQIWKVLSETNKYFSAQEPWKQKDNLARMGTILNTTVQILKRVALITQAIMPESSSKLLDFLGVKQTDREFKNYLQIIPDQTHLPKPEAIFPRIVIE